MQNLKGKVCLLTGATQGIGRAAAFEIAKTGMTLVLVARDRTRGEETVAEVKKRSGNDKVDLLLGDLSVQADVRAVVTAFQNKYDRLDVLCNNAGAIFTKREVSKDGLEMTFALNHMAYYLLTDLLLPLLKQSAPSRIVNVASQAHRRGTLNFSDLQREKNYRSFEVYGQSKLANIVYTYELARRLSGTGVTVNCLHPGVVASGFGKNTPGLLKFLVGLAAPFMITPEQGAQTIVYLTTSPEVEGITGKYFDKCKEIRSNKESYDPEVASKLFAVSETLIRR